LLISVRGSGSLDEDIVGAIAQPQIKEVAEYNEFEFLLEKN
jgi:hypothetical protein